jgi:hypothetical protein
VALCAIYLIDDWRQVLVLVTAFTVGHSITLALATLGLVQVNAGLIEFLIPMTILTTAIINLFVRQPVRHQTKVTINYLFAGFFGLIHGLGFSNYLMSLLGRDSSILMQLLAFNIGLEVGQIIIVGIFMAISFLFVSIFGVNRRDWKLVISAAIAGIALSMALESTYW